MKWTFLLPNNKMYIVKIPFNSILRSLGVLLCGVFLLCSISCSSDDSGNGPGESDGAITASLQFSDGESTEFAFTPEKDDLIKPYLYGPNGNGHYKLHLRGERGIGDKIYTLNIYVTMGEEGVGTYPFGRAWQWYDEGYVTEIHVGVTEKGNPLALKQYFSFEIDNAASKGLEITSLSDNHVKGTFSGLAAYAGSDTVTITNGTFDIAINRGDWED